MEKNRKKIIIANWKMNGLLAVSMQQLKLLRTYMLQSPPLCDVVICPPFTLLRDMAEKIPGTGIELGGQNCHFEADGAYTGEISGQMLRDMTCRYVILGHSERRQHNNENSELIQKKAEAAIKAKLTVILCVGESAYERDNDLTKVVIREQLLNSIPQNANDNNIIIAYEPVWAIGSGLVPTEEQIAKTHAYIQGIVKELPQIANGVRIIYGGSTSGDNAESLLSTEGVDGLLVGKSSLDPKQFWKMIESAN